MAATRAFLGIIVVFSAFYGFETTAQVSACESYLEYSVSWGEFICW